MTLFPRALLVAAVTLTSIAADQVTKLWAQATLPHFEMHSYFGDFLRLGYTKNYGAFLGLGNHLPESWRFWIFTILVAGFLAALLLYTVFAKSLTRTMIASLSLIFSGGLSNLYDRLMHEGGVVDFLNVGVAGLRTGIFNVADVAIMLGAMLVIWQTWKYPTQTESTPA